MQELYCEERVSKNNMISLKYAAGFFDGEGCISIGKIQQQYYINYRTRITIGQSGKIGMLILKQLQDRFGGIVIQDKGQKYLENRHYRVAWVWRLSETDGFYFLKRIYPYLITKRNQADLMIEFQKIKSCGKRCSFDFERIEKYSYYETVKQEMMFLNKRK